MSTEVLDKHRQIICRSELVANEDDLAAKIIGMSRLVQFEKGQVLMTHGEDADDVYFILFGSVRVSINSNFIDTREAPQTIGEMAAMKPGAARSADVSVESDKLEARVISAHDFRTLMLTHTEFSTRLSSMVDSMNRGKSRNHIARSPEEIYPKRPDLARAEEIFDGWLIGTNIANREKLRIIQAACNAVGLTLGKDVVINFPNT